MMKRRSFLFLPFIVALLLKISTPAVATASSPPTLNQTAAATWYLPPRLVNWQYQLSDNGKIAYIPGVQLYIIDLDTARTQLKALKTRSPSAKIICYFSAGSFEDFRVDDDKNRGAYSISKSEWKGVLGNALDGWPGERWLNIKSSRVVSIMSRRMKFAKSIGCDGVDPDNVDGYSNNSGFKLTKTDQIVYNKMLAVTAHSLGLSVGLKNTVELLKELASEFDFFVNESCFTYNECSKYSAVGLKKPVLGVEYCNAKEKFGEPTQDPSIYCPIANSQNWHFLIKKDDLGAARETCAQYCKREKCTAGGRPSSSSKKPNVCPAFFT
jgi:endo-alpha-1,4-polygalactosaminidase (GH114 family)